VPQISPAYALLNRFADKLMSQDEFTQHIRNVMRFITSIEHGEMLELLRTLNLTSSGAFKSIEDPISGSVDFAYDVQVQANAGTQEKRLTIPETITFNMPILHDGDAVDIKAELRYRVPKEEGNKKVQLGIALVNKVWDEFDQLEKLGAKVASDTGLLTIVGSSTNNYRSNSPKD
jgi:adenine C2-methylase RlmN of 23S rRNA A2503 and tRNA A37